jgi:hypothetical protein
MPIWVLTRKKPSKGWAFKVKMMGKWASEVLENDQIVDIALRRVSGED